MYLTHWNLINPDVVLGHEDVIVKIRYRKQANRCTVTLLDDQRLHIQLHEPLVSIASGQQLHFIGIIPYWEEGLLSNQQSFSLHFSKK